MFEAEKLKNCKFREKNLNNELLLNQTFQSVNTFAGSFFKYLNLSNR